MNQSKIRDFRVLSLSVRSGFSAEERERARWSERELTEQLRGHLLELRRDYPDAGALYLETCHRIELYTVGVSLAWLKQFGLDKKGLPLRIACLLEGESALEHLAATACGLDSEVLGETQITGQLKAAAVRARDLDVFGKGLLDRIFQMSLRVNKRVRSSTVLGSGVVSVAHAALDGLKDLFDRFDDKRALVVGAGSMSIQALERLLEWRVRQVTWINRSAEKIKQNPLAIHTEVADYSKIHQLIPQHHIVVVATGAQTPIVHLDELRKAFRTEKNVKDPCIVLDLGLPRNVEDQVRQIEGVFLRNVDEFRDRAADGLEQRRGATVAAREILRQETRRLVATLDNSERGKMLGELLKYLEDLRKLELDHINDLEKRQELGYHLRASYSRLFHRLVEELDGTDEDLAHQVLETLLRAWRHPESWPQRNLRSEPK